MILESGIRAIWELERLDWRQPVAFFAERKKSTLKRTLCSFSARYTARGVRLNFDGASFFYRELAEQFFTPGALEISHQGCEICFQRKDTKWNALWERKTEALYCTVRMISSGEIMGILEKVLWSLKWCLDWVQFDCKYTELFGIDVVLQSQWQKLEGIFLLCLERGFFFCGNFSILSYRGRQMDSVCFEYRNF